MEERLAIDVRGCRKLAVNTMIANLNDRVKRNLESLLSISLSRSQSAMLSSGIRSQSVAGLGNRTDPPMTKTCTVSKGASV
jgi:hypothetical protein